MSSRHARRHKHERRHEKKEKRTTKGHEGSRERGRVKHHKESKKDKKRSKHRHSKKKSHQEEEESPTERHHHSPSRSPVKKLGIEELAAVTNDDSIMVPSASNTPLTGEGLLASTSLLPPPTEGVVVVVGVTSEEGGATTRQELSDEEGEGGGVGEPGRSEFSVPASGGASEVTQQNGETNTDTTDDGTLAAAAGGVPEGAGSELGAAADTDAAGDSVGCVAARTSEETIGSGGGTQGGGAQEDEMLEDAVEISVNVEEVGSLDSTLLMVVEPEGDTPPGTNSSQKGEGGESRRGKEKDHPGECVYNVCVRGGLEWEMG